MALPKDITYLITGVSGGVADTSDRVTTTIDPRQGFTIGEHVARLKPNSHQLLAWVNANARRVPTKASRFSHQETTGLPGYVTFLGATETSQGTSLTFDRQFQFPTVLARLDGTENIYIPSTSSWSTLTITGVRNFGRGLTSSFLRYGEKLKIIGGGFTENRTMGTGQQKLPVVRSYRTGIFDYPVELSGTKAAEVHTDGDPFQVALLDAWDKCTKEQEASLLFAAPVDDATTYTAGPLHTMTGLMSAVTFNTFAADGPPTYNVLNEMIREWVRWNKLGGAIACSAELGEFLMQQIEKQVVYNQNLTKIGLYVKQFQSRVWPEPFDLLYVDMFSEDPTLMGTVLFLPRSNQDQGILYRPLIGNEDRELKYIPDDAASPRIDKKAGTILGELGYEYLNQETFAIATGFQF